MNITSTPPHRLSCIALAGPTASGKTGIALALAQRTPLEIISVDSALVYQGMDIGTAKPTPDELAQVPHHLINIRDPKNAYSAAEFAADASKLIADIQSRGKLPLLVGGTMLYFKALLEGLDELPRANAALREQLQAQAQALGWPALHAQLGRIDPITAGRLAPNDSQRIGRALEIFELTGKPMSELLNQRNAIKNAADPQVLASSTRLISLEPANRSWLHDRIAQRFDAMLAQGFLDEVKALRARGDLSVDLPSMRCVGYRQAWEVLEGTAPMAQLRDKGIFATRQLAKRQLTWLRSMKQRQVVACDQAHALEQVWQLIQSAA